MLKKQNYEETLTVTTRKTLPGNYKLKHVVLQLIFTSVVSASLVNGYLFKIGNFITDS